MALSRIDWSQINTDTIPSGITVNIGSPSSSINEVYTDNLYLENVNILSLIESGSSIWSPTGSFLATTNNLEITGSVVIKGDLLVEGKTTLIQKDNINDESLVVSGLMKIVKNEINSQIASASLEIENLGKLSDRSKMDVLDLGNF